MLDFKSLLAQVDVDPGQTLIVRHAPVEKSLKRVLPWLVVDQPALWLAYQQIQWSSLEKAMIKARYIASFIGQDPSKGTFAGIYRIGGHRVLDHTGYQSFPGNAELEALGMTGRQPDMGDCLAFELEQLDHWREWVGRLTVRWPQPNQNWWRWASRATFPVETIEAESRFVRGMPRWQDVVLTHSELQNLPISWRTALSQWRGIYFIFDTASRSGYVGSAYGTDNIYGRWRDYARTGHGGNRGLKDTRHEDLRFSILELTSPNLEPADVIQIEVSWKDRLHSREFGLNRN